MTSAFPFNVEWRETIPTQEKLPSGASCNEKPFGKAICNRFSGTITVFLFEVSVRVPDGKTRPLDDLKQGKYIDLLEPDKYYTVTPVRRVRRQRICGSWDLF
jgi:hypothetical protein